MVEGEKGPIDITPKELAVRTLTQEYGGGAFRISDDQLVFSNYKDQRLYTQHILHKGNNNTSLSSSLLNWQLLNVVLVLLSDSSPKPITPDYGSPAVTYADGVFDSRFHRYITVREGSFLAPLTVWFCQ